MASLRSFLSSINETGSTISLREVAQDLGAGSPISVMDLIHAPGAPGGPSPDAVTLIEPAPDHETGGCRDLDAGILGLGDDLDMRVFSEALFQGTLSDATASPHQHEPIQGFLGNCPLAAVLCAMAHVPAQRTRLRNVVVNELAIPVRSHRVRKSWEYCHSPSNVPNPLPRIPPSDFLEAERVFVVHINRSFPLFDPDQDGISTIVVSPVLHTVSPALQIDLQLNEIHYMRSSNGVLWPSIIEKAYAVSRGGNAYDGINNDVGLVEAMEDMTGGADGEPILPDQTQSGSQTLISDTDLINRLMDHGVRPTILGSIGPPFQAGSPPDNRIIENHTYAVISFDGANTTVVDPLEETPATREIIVSFPDLRANFGEIVQGP